MNIDPKEKMIDVSKGRIEKYILRKAFDTPDDPYLPADILWRQKEQFSDGVGYGWIDALRDHADAQVSDHQFAVAKHRFPYNTPATKEAYYYRQIFDGIYPSLGAARTIPEGKSIACSTERALAWDASFRGRADQSGRSVACTPRPMMPASLTSTRTRRRPGGTTSTAWASSLQRFGAPPPRVHKIPCTSLCWGRRRRATAVLGLRRRGEAVPGAGRRHLLAPAGGRSGAGRGRCTVSSRDLGPV